MIITQTIGTTGRDFSTIQAWEDQLDDGGVFSSGDDAVGEIYNDSVFDESVTINGGGTVGLNSTTLTVAEGERHDGTAGSGARIEQTSAVTSLLQTAPLDQTIEWIEVERSAVAISAGGGISSGASVAGTTKTIQYVIVHDIYNNGSAAISGISNSANSITHNVHNCIIYNIINGGSGEAIGFNSGGNTANISNLTIHNCKRGVVSSSTGRIFTNCLVTDCSVDCFSGTVSASSDYNATDDLTAPGSNSLTGIDSADQYTSESAPISLLLKAGADVIGEGTDLGTTPAGVNIDILGRDRDAEGDTWDIGAHQFVAAGGAFVPRLPLLGVG